MPAEIQLLHKAPNQLLQAGPACLLGSDSCLPAPQSVTTCGDVRVRDNALLWHLVLGTLLCQSQGLRVHSACLVRLFP